MSRTSSPSLSLSFSFSFPSPSHVVSPTDSLVNHSHLPFDFSNSFPLCLWRCVCLSVYIGYILIWCSAITLRLLTLVVLDIFCFNIHYCSKVWGQVFIYLLLFSKYALYLSKVTFIILFLKILSSTTVLNIGNIKKCFLSTKSAYSNNF